MGMWKRDYTGQRGITWEYVIVPEVGLSYGNTVADNAAIMPRQRLDNAWHSTCSHRQVTRESYEKTRLKEPDHWGLSDAVQARPHPNVSPPPQPTSLTSLHPLGVATALAASGSVLYEV